ncbi:hypothetical protein MHI43_30885 [Paenibacillus sp. FSL H8-0457]|nr:hypothetical protein [Paenibacillus sp. FSL H8-457]
MYAVRLLPVARCVVRGMSGCPSTNGCRRITIINDQFCYYL